MPKSRWTGLLMPMLLAWAAPTSAALLEPELLAVRGGTNAFTIDDEFDFKEIGLRFRLPWEWDWGRWEGSSHLDLGAGHLEAFGEEAELYTIGPSIGLRRGRFLVDIGTAPGYLTDDFINGRSLGGGFQFTSHIGLYYAPERWGIGVRIQHTSNASVYSHNEGLDLQMLDLWLRF